jgi:hypothetical protein
MHVNIDKSKNEIVMSEDHEWVERIGKTAYMRYVMIQLAIALN